jgi:methionyl-tRNA formyltransferase
MQIVFFGSPAIALPSLKKLLEVEHSIGLIITQPDRPSGRGKRLIPCPVKKAALDLNVPYYQPLKIRKDHVALDKIKINFNYNVA